MAKDDSKLNNQLELQSYPLSKAMRLSIFSIFLIQASITAVLIRDLLRTNTAFPWWFVPPAIIGCAFMLTTIGMMATQVICCWNKTSTPTPGISRGILFGIPATVFCSTAVHSFHPFRFDSFEHVAELPFVVLGTGPRLKFNFLFSAIAMAIALVLTSLYLTQRRRTASAGFIVLAGLLLFPNDNCQNAFNHRWNELIGASPLMFLPASVAALAGVAGLHGILPRFSFYFIMSLCVSILLVGFGHISKVIW